MKWTSAEKKLPDVPLGESCNFLVSRPVYPKSEKNCVSIVSYGDYSPLRTGKTKRGWFIPDVDYGDLSCSDVQAWMPLPEPYVTQGR